MNAFLKFNKGMLGVPVPVQLWVALLVSVNLVVPLFYLHRFEAQVVLVGFLVSATLMTWLTGRFGFTRIVGLGHIVWIPMLGYLAMNLTSIPADDVFGIWIRSLFVLNSVSLAIDAVDLFRYVAGDHRETVAGL